MRTPAKPRAIIEGEGPISKTDVVGWSEAADGSRSAREPIYISARTQSSTHKSTVVNLNIIERRKTI